MKKIIIANWKMNPLTLKEAEKMFTSVVKSISSLKKTEVVICPPFLYLERLKKISSKISLGGQNAFELNPPSGGGAFTGEISAEMLYNIGARYVILGHSERRSLPSGRGEANSEINKKIKASLFAGLVPIVCVGEKERDESHAYFHIVKTKIEECLKGISKSSITKIIIAYEPIWSISTTQNRRDATPEDSLEMAIFIRRVLSDLSSPKVAGETRVIYGGSVHEKNAYDFLKNGGVDGLLPGRASLNPKKFAEIIKMAESL